MEKLLLISKIISFLTLVVYITSVIIVSANVNKVFDIFGYSKEGFNYVFFALGASIISFYVIVFLSITLSVIYFLKDKTLFTVDHILQVMFFIIIINLISIFYLAFFDERKFGFEAFLFAPLAFPFVYSVVITYK